MGAFIAPDTVEGNAFCVAGLTKTMEKKLGILDDIDAMRDTKTETDVVQLRYKFLNICANSIPNYWLRCMPSRHTAAVMAALVDPLLRVSAAAIAVVEASPMALQWRWWLEAQRPPSLGGIGVGVATRSCASPLTPPPYLPAGDAWRSTLQL